jgi:hypothetical protein
MRRHLLTVGTALALSFLVRLPAAEAVQKRQSASVPAGTQIQVRLGEQLHTGETQVGQTFSGTIAESVVSGSKTVLARGTALKGRVTEVVSSGRLARPASITLELTSLSTDPLHIDGKSHLLRNVALMGGGAAAGALVGGVVGGKKGAAAGAAVGAGAGAATAYMTGKKEIVLPAETLLTFVVAGSTAKAGVATTAAPAEPEAAAAPRSAASYPERERGAAVRRARETAEVLVFSDREQQIIRNYYSGGRGLPPGLAKKGKLPPGLAKQLRRNGSLPPGLQKRYGAQPFPEDLSQELPKLPAGYSRILIAGRAVLLDGNHNILDILAVVR